MWKISIKGLWAHKRRVFATGMAVVLGVAFLAGTLVFGDSLRSGIDDAFQEANAGTDAIVRSTTEFGTESSTQRGVLDVSMVATVQGIDGVAEAVPSVEGTAQIVGADGDPIGGDGPPTIGGNWIDDADVNPYDLVEGRAPAAAGEVVIDRGSAEDGHLAVGDHTQILVPEPVDVEVVGIASFGEEDRIGGVTFAAFTLPVAQELLLDSTDVITSVIAVADPGVTQAELTDRIDPVLPSGVEALTGVELTAEQNADIGEDFLDFFETFLLVFAGIALLVATFSIYNTFSIIVAQRTRESALLRALGASRRQVLWATAAEALVIGVVASALGLLAGIGLASGLAALIASTDLGLADTIVVETNTAVWAMAIGILVTLVASVAPAIRASKVAPLAALRDVAFERTGRMARRAVIGLVTAGVGAVLVISGSSADGSLGVVGLGALACVVGVVVLGPLVARSASSVLGAPVAGVRGVTGGLARRNAMRNPRRTAGTAAALMVGVGVVTMFTVFAASMRAGIDETVSEQFTGDLVIESDGFSGAGLTPELRDAIAALPEVEAAAGFGGGALEIDGAVEEPTIVDLPVMAQVMDLGITQGSFTGLGPDQLAVSDEWADEQGLGVGDAVTVTYADGVSEPFTIAATYANRAIVGGVAFPEAAWLAHAAQPFDIAVGVRLADGVDLEAGKAAVQAVADRFHAPDVQDSEEYIDSVTGEIDQMLGVIYGLLVLAILIALMGIANTLSLSVHERTRELGLLRAVGQTRSQVRSMVRWESVLVATFGTIGGVGLGVFLGWGLTRGMAASEGFGSFTAPVGQLVGVLVVGAAVGVIAGLRPARRAAKLPVLDALAV
jgi:putative ABC transport system permease protein